MSGSSPKQRFTVKRTDGKEKTGLWFDERSKRLLDNEPMILYHQTSEETSKLILNEGFIRGKEGIAGGGIYFARSSKQTDKKAHDHGVVLECLVLAGKRNKDTKAVHKNTDFAFDNLRKEGYDSVQITGMATGHEVIVYNYDQVVAICDTKGRSVPFISSEYLSKQLFTSKLWSIHYNGTPLKHPHKLSPGGASTPNDSLSLTLRDPPPALTPATSRTYRLIHSSPQIVYHLTSPDLAEKIASNGYKAWDTPHGKAFCFDMSPQPCRAKEVLLGVVVLPGTTMYAASDGPKVSCTEAAEQGFDAFRYISKDGEKLVLWKKDQVLFMEPLNYRTPKSVAYGRVGRDSTTDEHRWHEHGSHDINKTCGVQGLTRCLTVTRRDAPEGFPSRYNAQKLRFLKNPVRVLYCTVDGKELKTIAEKGLNRQTKLYESPRVSSSGHLLAVAVFVGKVGTNDADTITNDKELRVRDARQFVHHELLTGSLSLRDAAVNKQSSEYGGWFRRLYRCVSRDMQ